MASGFLEVQGFSVALAAMDSMCKTANINILAVDANNPPDEKKAFIPVVIQVKLAGGIGDVVQSLKAGYRTAERFLPQELILMHHIASDKKAIETLLKAGKLRPGRKAKKSYPALAAVDVQCFANALAVLDGIVKNADVDVVDVKKYLGGRMVTLIVGGSVSAVQIAAEHARLQTASRVKNAAVITNPHVELYQFIG